MSKIVYHKSCRHHDQVAKAKRMLNKIEKQFGGFQGEFYCNIQLTGVNDIDRQQVRSYVVQHLKKLKEKVDNQLYKNERLINGDWNEQYEEGFYTPPFSDQLQIAEALNQVHSYIWNQYPEIEVKNSDVFTFTAETPEGKHVEAMTYFKSHPVIGFNQETFGVFTNGEKRRLYPLTFSMHDLQEATGVYVEYQ